MSVDTPEIVSSEAPVRSRPRWGRVLAWAGLLILLVILYFGLRNAQRTSMQVGQTAPTFTLTSFDGQQVNLANLRGKVVVVNFWASWCKPCEQEAADLEAAWRYYQPRGDVVFLGVDYVDTEPEAKAYLQKFGITYPNGPDLRTKISQAYRITGVPETYIIDRTGKLVNFKFSPFLSLSEIKSMIDPVVNQ